MNSCRHHQLSILHFTIYITHLTPQPGYTEIHMSTISPNALSLFFPNDQPTPTTVDHLLNLPPLISSFSPALASLHLARIRLGLLIPAGTFDQTAWCRSCGGLRQIVEASGPVSPSPSPRKGRGKKRAGGVVKKRTVRPKECAICGTPFKAPKIEDPARSFPSARTVRATRSSTVTQASETVTLPYQVSNPPIVPPIPMDIDPPVVPVVPEEDQPMPVVTEFTASQKQEYQLAPPPPPPRYVYNNGLTHVYTSAPNLPTYPQPPAKHISPPPKEKSRKRKKSGLAKLLAENREREGGRGSGSWGLE